MNASQDSTVERFASSRSRRRAALGVGIAVVLGGIALAWALVPRPCDTLAKDMWDQGGLVEPTELAAELRALGVTESACADTSRAIDRAYPVREGIIRETRMRWMLEGRTSEQEIERLSSVYYPRVPP
jgi:hypothetical protein